MANRFGLYCEEDFDTGDIRIGGERVPREIISSMTATEARMYIDAIKRRKLLEMEKKRMAEEADPYGRLSDYDNVARYKYIQDFLARPKASAQPPEPVKEQEPESTPVPDGPIKPRMPELDL